MVFVSFAFHINTARGQRQEKNLKSMFGYLGYHSHLWLEKEIKSVANITRSDIAEFLQLSGAADLKPEVKAYGLKEANRALLELKAGRVRGAKVLVF